MSEQEDLNSRLAMTLKSLEETEEISSAINTELYLQREKLERTRVKVAKVDDNLKKCEKTTDNITSYWKNFVNFFSKQSTIESLTLTTKVNPVINNVTSSQNKTIETIDTNNVDSINLINQKVKGLKQNAVNFGQELDLHNEILDDINQTVNRAGERIKPLNNRIQKLL